jgi:hypothetical protein
MRTFVFNLSLLFISLVLGVMLLRPMIAAYHLVTQPVAPVPQPASPQLPAIEYGNDFDTDYQFMPPQLINLDPVVSNL